MKRDEIGDLLTFLAVVEERSFTRAAAKLGTSQSAVSHTMRRLEDRLDIRLLTRTTRSVSPTEAGQKLAATLEPAFADIKTQLDRLNDYRDKVTGTLRITSTHTAAEFILLPVCNRLLREHPELNIEISVDGRMIDLVADGFDAGVRLGEHLEKDMVAVPIGPDLKMVVAGSPDYLAQNGIPQSPHDLTAHSCINLRMPTSGGLYAWEFEEEGREFNVRVEGQFTSNVPNLIIQAAISGGGLCCLPDDTMKDALRSGKLVPVLENWCPYFPGFHLYYPSRRQHSAAFRLFLDALRESGFAPGTVRRGEE